MPWGTLACGAQPAPASLSSSVKQGCDARSQATLKPVGTEFQEDFLQSSPTQEFQGSCPRLRNCTAGAGTCSGHHSCRSLGRPNLR